MIGTFSTKISSPIANGNGFAVVNPNGAGALIESLFSVFPMETALVTLIPFGLLIATTFESAFRPLDPNRTSTAVTEFPKTSTSKDASGKPGMIILGGLL